MNPAECMLTSTPPVIYQYLSRFAGFTSSDRATVVTNTEVEIELPQFQSLDYSLSLHLGFAVRVSRCRTRIYNLKESQKTH
jgi:hypothetical protein